MERVFLVEADELRVITRRIKKSKEKIFVALRRFLPPTVVVRANIFTWATERRLFARKMFM